MPSSADIIRHDSSPPPPGQTPWVGPQAAPTVIKVVEADPGWPELYADVAGRILGALGPAVVALDHVGSTSVPGLPAKPIIDVDLTVADPADEPAWLPALTDAGFRLVIREPWWHEHRCLVLDCPRSNVHVFGPDSPELVRHRIFRDWLRQHPEDAALYANAKHDAAAESTAVGEGMMAYNRRKESVIHDIYNRAFLAAGLL